MPKFPKYGIFCPFQYVKFSEPIHYTKHNSLINCLLMQQSTHTHHTHIFSTFPLQTTTATIHHQINVIHHYDSSNTKTPERLKCDSTAIVHPLFSLQANPHRTYTEPTPGPHPTSRQRKKPSPNPPNTHKTPPPIPFASLEFSVPIISIAPPFTSHYVTTTYQTPFYR